MKNIYAIRDNVAKAIVGGLFLYPHDAPAIRFFCDVAEDPQTMIARHVTEHDLVHLGTLDEDDPCVIEEAYSEPRVVITGAAWKASQQPSTEP